MANGKHAQRAALVLLNCSFLWVTIEVADRKNVLDALKIFAVIVQFVLKCLKHALSNNLNETDDGIWGGMTPSERRELNNQNNQ